MALAFADIITLLHRLEGIEKHDPPYLRKEKPALIRAVIDGWFKSHRQAVQGLSVESGTALLSTFLLERRTDRVYGLQPTKLCRVIARGLGLQSGRARDLAAYRTTNQGDLAQCVARVISAGGPPALPKLTLEDVNDMLDSLAQQCHFSGPKVTSRAPPSGSSEPQDVLIGKILRRAHPDEAKWIVRLILKNFAPVIVDEQVLLRSFHFLLPDVLRFQNDFQTALGMLKTSLGQFPDRPDVRSEALHRISAAPLLRPAVGVKVGRPDFIKARSIDSCLDMLGQREWVLERKYDGEYCEIHIDMQHVSLDPSNCIRIFSKSGKDSTADRRGLHSTLVKSLRLGTPECKIQTRAILLGELVVWSDATNSVLPFDRIRKHVSRSGIVLGTEADSQAHPHEHLAIVFFDLLLLDDEVVMSRPVEERRVWLRAIYTKIPGHAMSAEWKVIDFSDPSARGKERLIVQFAASISARCEGLILKPCGTSYFPLGPNPDGLCRKFIKLKKDYMLSMGDEADFAVIGASYTAQQALRSGLPGIKWTEFHLGCLLNAEEVRRFDQKPRFRHVGSVQQEACIPKPILKTLNLLGTYNARPYSGTPSSDDEFEIVAHVPLKMDATFSTPFVLEVLGSGFVKPSNCAFYMLRHPRVTKLHQDRSWKDSITFRHLQTQAEAAVGKPVDGETQETKRWIERLQRKCRRKAERESTTPRSAGSPRVSKATSAASVRSPAVIGTTAVPACRVHETDPRVVDTQVSRPKRPRAAETPCPNPKKVCTSRTPKLIRVPQCSPASSMPERHRRPLREITNSPDKEIRKVDDKSKPSAPPSLADRLNSLVRLTLPTLLTAPVSASARTSASNHRSTTQCTSSRCLFRNAVIYLAPCIASTPYIAHDLMNGHDVCTSSSLRDWDRASFSHDPNTEVVSESQSHEGMRKIVVVEGRRMEAVRAVVRDVTRLNHGGSKERIEVYDWRVLEASGHHGLGVEGAKDWFVGATMFDDTRQRTIFVSWIPGLGHDL